MNSNNKYTSSSKVLTDYDSYIDYVLMEIDKAISVNEYDECIDGYYWYHYLPKLFSEELLKKIEELCRRYGFENRKIENSEYRYVGVPLIYIKKIKEKHKLQNMNEDFV